MLKTHFLVHSEIIIGINLSSKFEVENCNRFESALIMNQEGTFVYIYLDILISRGP